MLVALANHDFINLQQKTFALNGGVTAVPQWNKAN